MIMNDLFSIKGKVVIVTGALGLLGKNHCKALCEAGGTVVVADMNQEKCIEFASQVLENSIGVYLDVTKKESVLKLMDVVLKKYGKIDVLVNNAAINDMFD